MTILVTGAAGFIGSNFVLDWFDNSQEDVVSIDILTYAGNLENLSSFDGNSHHHFIRGNISDCALVSEILKKYQIRAIVNFAAESHVDNSIKDASEFIKTNICGTYNLINSCKDHLDLVRFIHVSTDEVFGSLSHDDPPFNENTPYDPRNPYSATKAASDHLVRAYVNTHKIDAVVTNCSNNYGPRQNQEKFIPTVIRHIQKNTPVPVYGRGLNVRDWLFAEDHCDALLTIGKNFKSGERYNIGGGFEATNIEMVNMILDIMGKNMLQTWINFVPDRKGHELRYSMDSGKIFKELGWKAKTPIALGLEKTLEWYL